MPVLQNTTPTILRFCDCVSIPPLTVAFMQCLSLLGLGVASLGGTFGPDLGVALDLRCTVEESVIPPERTSKCLHSFQG